MTPALAPLALEFALPLKAGEARLCFPRDLAPAEWAALRAWALVTLAAAEGALGAKAGKQEKP